MNFSGIVQKSLGEGAKIGFPTANIPLPDRSLSGIFAGEVVVAKKVMPAAIYADQKRGLLEAHILDFEGDLYGQEIEVWLQKKIRDDATFENVEDLKRAIAADVAATRAFFGL